MLVSALTTAGVSIVTSTISSLVTFFITKRKYNSEVDSNLIKNMQDSLEFYKKLSDDNKERLEEQINRNDNLEKEVKELKNQLLNLMSSICIDLSCQMRKRSYTLYGNTSGQKIQES
jgi:hypothetical protein